MNAVVVVKNQYEAVVFYQKPIIKAVVVAKNQYWRLLLFLSKTNNQGGVVIFNNK